MILLYLFVAYYVVLSLNVVYNFREILRFFILLSLPAAIMVSPYLMWVSLTKFPSSRGTSGKSYFSGFFPKQRMIRMRSYTVAAGEHRGSRISPAFSLKE